MEDPARRGPLDGGLGAARPLGDRVGVVRVLMTTTGYPGHLLPLVPFARTWMREGHRVVVAVPRSRAATVRRLGLEPCGVADPPAHEVARLLTTSAELPPREGHAHMVSEGFAGVAGRAALRDVLQLVAAWR